MLNTAETQDPTHDRSKFKKVEMPMFAGQDLDSWLFQVERYFDIHKLSNSEKIVVAVINFDGIALAWYRWTENR